MKTALLFLVLALCSLRATAKLTVHLVSHTHDDIGWLKTVDQYQWGLNQSIQTAHVNVIISSVISSLMADPARRFTYVEIGFFSRWWKQQNDAVKDNVKMLAGTGRLTFANGGWCMHDEAAAHFLDMIDQTTLGHRFLQRTLNVVPKVGWQVDPFGHSATQASLLSAKAGFLGLHFARMDYQDYNQRTANKQREFLWQASPSLPEQSIYSEIMMGTTYCLGGTGGYFSYEVTDELNKFGNSNYINNFIIDDPEVDQYNAPEMVNNFVNQAMSDATITNGEHMMWPMGCDFQYSAAEWYFMNLDKLIRAVNADGRVQVLYSTALDYTLAKLSENVTYASKTDDLFPYADGPHQFWTGYFTSRAALKRYVRTLSSYWVATRQIESFGNIPSGEVPKISDALGIAQHHDAVAGTAKQHVAFDYAKRMYAGYAEDQGRVSQAFMNILRVHVTHCPLSNISDCPSTQSLSVKGSSLNVIVWNPNAHNRTASVEVPVPSAGVTAKGTTVNSFVVYASSAAVTNYANSNPNWQPYTMAVSINLPAAGYAVFTLNAAAEDVPAPAPDVTVGDIVISTGAITAVFSADTGLLVSVTNLVNGVTVNITQEWCTFPSSTGDSLSGQKGGAYIFRPVTNSTCVSITPSGRTDSTKVVVSAPNYFVVEQVFSYITQRIIGSGDSLDMEFTVSGVPIDDNIGKEVVARFQTNIANNGYAYTDSNGREMQQRLKDYRATWPLVQTEEVAGNYYPINALIFINDTRAQLNIFTDASVGGGSIHNGEMYVTVHRRLVADDSRGVGEPLNETEYVRPYVNTDDCPEPCWRFGEHLGAPLIVRGRFTLSIESTAAGRSPMRRTREVMDEKYFAPLTLYTSDNDILALTDSILHHANAFPATLQLLTVQLVAPKLLIVRLGHRYAVDEDAARSQSTRFDLKTLLKSSLFNVASIDEYSLMTTELLKENVGVVDIKPMDIRTFFFNLA